MVAVRAGGPATESVLALVASSVSDFFEFFDRTSVKFNDAPVAHQRLKLLINIGDITHLATASAGFYETGDKRVLQSEVLEIAYGFTCNPEITMRTATTCCRPYEQFFLH